MKKRINNIPFLTFVEDGKMKSKMKQIFGFIIYSAFITQMLVYVSVDIKAQEQEKIVYNDVLKALEEHQCLECHNSTKREGNVDLSNYEEILKVLKPGHASQSLLVHAVEIKMMPALGQAPPFFPEDLELFENWINSGAPVKEFKKIRNVLKDFACIDCHKPPKASGDVNLTTYEEVMKYVVPMDTDGSLLLSSVKIKSMPLDTNLPRIHPEDLALINEWISSGAPKD